jgi:hypothetical protein
VVGPLTGHCHFKGHLLKSVKGELKQRIQPHRYISCDSEAIAYLRFRHLGHYFMEPSDYHDAPHRKVQRFIRSVGLAGNGSTIDHKGRRERAGSILTHPLPANHSVMFRERVIKSEGYHSNNSSASHSNRDWGPTTLRCFSVPTQHYAEVFLCPCKTVPGSFPDLLQLSQKREHAMEEA